MAHGPTDLVEDLDAAVEPAADATAAARAGEPARRGRRTPSWPEGTPTWVRSPLGVLAASLLTALAVGGAGVQQVRARAEADLAHQHDLALVQVGAPMIAFDGSRLPSADRAETTVQVDVTNGGAQPASVSVVGLSADHVELAGPVAPVELDAGESRTLLLDVVVDCTRVSRPTRTSTPVDAAPQWVELALDTGGRRQVERRLVQASYPGQLAEMLVWICHPSWGATAQVDLSPQQDGRLRAVVTSTSDVATRLGVDADPVLGLRSDVALPVDLPAGGSVTLHLSLAPDCTGAAGGLGRDVQITERVADDANTTSTISDSTTAAAWVARQVTLACG